MSISLSRLVFAPSLAGTWKPIDDSYLDAALTGSTVRFIGTARLGVEQWNGIVSTGWSHELYPGKNVIPVNFVIATQQFDGTLKIDTGRYTPSDQTNGAGSVIATDFNGDGKDDVFLAAHNEAPFKLQASTVLLSNAAGTFDKIVLNDQVMAHDAQLVFIGGKPTILTSSFSEWDVLPPTSPIYTWNGSGFTVNDSTNRKDLMGVMSSAYGDLNNDGRAEMVFGDMTGGPGYPWKASNTFKIGIYETDGLNVKAAPTAILTPYFEARSEYDSLPTFEGGMGTHSFRTWLDDFNHDGLLDIMSAQSLWRSTDQDWPSMVQMLQNKGNFQFQDVSDTLNPDYVQDGTEFDYNLQRIDLDGSGIESYLSGRAAPYDAVRGVWVDSRHANYLLVNDGTGRLHVAMHEQFEVLGKQVLQYAAALYNDPYSLYVSPDVPTPLFHGYVNHRGLLNYVAEIQGFRYYNGHTAANDVVMVNVPVELDIRRDFVDTITITDRNQSQLIRTFAGADRIADSNAAAQASIDAGAGIDTVVYAGKRSAYQLTVSAQGDHVVTKQGLRDQLRNVERIEFADGKVALDVSGHAGTVAKLLGAVFGRSSVTNKEYVGIGLALLDGGMSTEALSQLAINARLGAAHSHVDLVTTLYTNVVGVAPPPADLAYYTGLLDSRVMSEAQLGTLAADTVLNQDNIHLIGLAASGLAFE